MKHDIKFYWTLFRSTFSLSTFTVGGGFVIVPLMKQKFVDGLHWIDEDEMLDIAAIASLHRELSRSTPPFWLATVWRGSSGLW